MVDRKAEACVHCHQSDTPLEQLPKSKRTWTFTKRRRAVACSAAWKSSATSPSCYNAACHQHRRDTAVLGVLDIVYSLDDIDRTMRTSALGIAGLSLGFIVIASLSVGLFVHRLVYRAAARPGERGAAPVARGTWTSRSRCAAPTSSASWPPRSTP